MKRASRLAQQRPISRILYKSVLEQVTRLRWHALPEKQTSGSETVKRRLKLRLRLAAPPQPAERIGELTPDDCSDLCHFLSRAEPVKPRHQRGVQACRHANRR